ncbi:hypothetical protein STEG23_013241, partial [Scotinomys teguina]
MGDREGLPEEVFLRYALKDEQNIARSLRQIKDQKISFQFISLEVSDTSSHPLDLACGRQHIVVGNMWYAPELSKTGGAPRTLSRYQCHGIQYQAFDSFWYWIL